MGALTARFLTATDGACLAAIEMDGWDTHANQLARLERRLAVLDSLVAALRDGLGSAWYHTLVVVATEFGRTVRPNGTKGTDHGTGSTLMMLGGAVRGGRILSDWPGLRPSDLFEGRDLQPTGSVEHLIAGALSEHFLLEPARVRRSVFPASGNAPFIQGLIRT